MGKLAASLLAPDNVRLFDHHGTRQHHFCHRERSMSSPFVQNFPNKLQLLRGINRRFELHFVQIFSPSPRVDDPLHLTLNEFELVFHLLFLRLQVLRLGKLPNSLQPRFELQPSVLELITNIPCRTFEIRSPIRVHTRVISVSIKRSAGLAPAIVHALAEAIHRQTKAALRSRFRDMISHGFHFRNLLEQPVEILIGKVIQRRVQP